MRIDAHQHYWKQEVRQAGDPDLFKADFLPRRLKPHLAANGIDRTIAVQGLPSVADTEFLLALCAEEETLAGAVGWLDMEADDFGEQLHKYARNPYFVGIRPMLHDLADTQWIIRPNVLQALNELAAAGVVLDLLVYPEHLPHIVTMLGKVPRLRAVVDHLAKPYISRKVVEPWKSHMSEIARYPNVYCKISGMVYKENGHCGEAADFRPYVDHVIRCFGTERIMFGSDWPVCLLSDRDYGQVCDLTVQSLPPGFAGLETDRLFGMNAAEFYGISE